jgi:glycosyltransferase involved in cell wall biosynthesis
MKRILFLIQWFPSEFSANALCDEKIINELNKDDKLQIDVLAYRPNGSNSYEEKNGIRIYRFRRSIWWNVVIDAQKKTSLKSSVILRVHKLFKRLNIILTIPIYPIVDVFPIRKFKKEALKLCLKNEYDMVVSENHGSDSLHAGLYLKKKKPSIKLITIFWDPISAKLPPKYFPVNFSKRRLIAEEIKVLKIADKVIGMKKSEKTISKIMNSNPLFSKYLFYDIPGIEKPKVSANYNNNKFIKKGKINIVFSGILSLPDRDPEYIIKCFNLTSRAKDINLIFLCTGEGKTKLNKLESIFSGSIINTNYVVRDELNSIYNNSDVLLNFGGRNPNMVPSKIFEYMSYGKPVISTYDIDNESSKSYFANYPLSICIDQKSELKDSAKSIDVFFDLYLDKKVDFNLVSETFVNNTPKPYVNLITQMLKGN